MMPFRVDFGARCALSGSVLVCGAPFLGWILVHGVWCVDFGARCAFLGSILVRGALMLGSITASGQQNLSRLERTWGESSPRPVEYGVLVLAHDALSGGFWCEVRPFGLGFGVRCVVFGVDFGARCAVFGLDFGARYVVRRFWGRFRCTVRRFWVRFWCAPLLGPWCTVSFLGSFLVCGAPFLGSILVHGVWCVDFGARCAFLGSILVRGALMLGSITASGQQDLSRLERTWGESSPRPVEYGALVLAHDAFLGGFWCEVRLVGLGVRCAVFGVDFGARCAVFGLDFGARCVVRRFWGRFRCTVRLFGFVFGVRSRLIIAKSTLITSHASLAFVFPRPPKSYYGRIMIAKQQ